MEDPASKTPETDMTTARDASTTNPRNAQQQLGNMLNVSACTPLPQTAARDGKPS